MLEQGFSSWQKRDFQQFIKANERWGRDNLDKVSQDVSFSSVVLLLLFYGVLFCVCVCVSVYVRVANDTHTHAHARTHIHARARNQVENKTPEEVQEYAAVFWKRYKSLSNADQLIGTYVPKAAARTPQP